MSGDDEFSLKSRTAHVSLGNRIAIDLYVGRSDAKRPAAYDCRKERTGAFKRGGRRASPSLSPPLVFHCPDFSFDVAVDGESADFARPAVESAPGPRWSDGMHQVPRGVTQFAEFPLPGMPSRY